MMTPKPIDTRMRWPERLVMITFGFIAGALYLALRHIGWSVVAAFTYSLIASVVVGSYIGAVINVRRMIRDYEKSQDDR